MKRLLRILAALGVLGILALAFGAAAFYAFILRDLPDIRSLDDYHPKLITRILAVDGTPISSVAEERRIIVPIEKIPRHVKEAFVAAEDGSFYTHDGLDYPGILRATLANLQAGGVRQGGSTITQQVAKTFLLSSERSYVRKLKDMVLARQIEAYLDKESILYLYLNQIYLGSGAHGIEAAAKIYFGKATAELTIAEAAMIAGVVPRPTDWSPRRNFEIASRKMRTVLRRMVEQGFITEDEREAALTEEIVLAEHDLNEVEIASAYFAEEVRRYLVEHFGEDDVKTQGFVVRTTLDAKRQVAAYEAVRAGLRAHDRRSGYRGPVRNAPETEWSAVLFELAIANAEAAEGDVALREGLVVELDKEKNAARVALGAQTETWLGIEAVKWARKPDPKVDGRWTDLKKIGQVLHVGDQIRLERIGESPDPDNPEGAPIARFTLYQKPLAQGALVSIDLDRRHLQAIVGGYEFRESQYNRALQMRRQPGSAFKPVIYASAIEHGYTPASIVYDTPIVYYDRDKGTTWKPGNYSDKFYGPITLRQALAKSRNVASIKLLRDVGLPGVIGTARRLGIASNLEDNLGLALGNSEVTLAELVRAYTSFATNGRTIDPLFILEVRDRDGNLLERDVPLLASQTRAEGYSAPGAEKIGPLLHANVMAGDDGRPDAMNAEMRRFLDQIQVAARTGDAAGDTKAPLPPGHVLAPETAYLMTSMLEAVVLEGTGQRVRALGRPVAGKTGTTNNLYDAWFIGYTPDICAGVWVGFDQARNLGKNETGSRAASPIFLEYMLRAHTNLPVAGFDVPDRIVFARIDRKTGLRARPGDRDALFQPFREGSAPDEMAPSAADGSASNGARLRLD